MSRVYLAECDCGYKSRSTIESRARQGLTQHDCQRWTRMRERTERARRQIVVDAYTRAQKLTASNGFVLAWDGHDWTLDLPAEDPLHAVPLADDDRPLLALVPEQATA